MNPNRIYIKNFTHYGKQNSLESLLVPRGLFCWGKTIIKVSKDFLLNLYKTYGTVFMSRVELKASLAKGI